MIMPSVEMTATTAMEMMTTMVARAVGEADDDAMLMAVVAVAKMKSMEAMTMLIMVVMAGTLAVAAA